MELHAVIIAGGSGTRFWPASRKALPKQFLKFEPHRSLIRATSDRLDGLIGKPNRWVVCGKAHAPLVQEHLPDLPAAHLLVEPKAMNTAPAIALANVHVLHANKDATVCVLPADHFIRDEAAFREALMRAAEAAQDGSLVTLGIQPTRADTGFGYIERDTPVGDAFTIKRFIEKPPQKDADVYAASGKHFWNGGIFVFRADAMQALFDAHAPTIAGPLGTYAKSFSAPALEEAFNKVPSISIDYAIAEKAPKMKVIPTSCGWSDVGGWDALDEVQTPDTAGNVLDPSVLLIDGKRNIARSIGGKKVCLVGVDDLIVVETPDAILVLKRGSGQRVREIVAALEKSDPTLV
jgi:mannose-1-phosphate guanylyltransferase/mannose-6-phosphate isomerase